MLNKPSPLFDANSEDFFKSMGQQFIEIATGKFQGESAVVQGWESQTAYAQASRGDALAGDNTEQRARAQGLWLGSNPDISAYNFSRQKFVKIPITGSYEINSILRPTYIGYRPIAYDNFRVKPVNNALWRVAA